MILHSRDEGDYSNRFVHVEGDHYQTKVIFDANEGEHFYGLGQETEDALDRKGSTCNEMGIKPVVSIWPTINPNSENYTNMSESNMLVRTEKGQYGTFSMKVLDYK